MGNQHTKTTKATHHAEPPREFSLSNKKLKLDTAQDVEEYVQVIGRIKNLTVVSLNGNTLGVEAAKALAEALCPHKTIKEVNLSDCFTGRLKEEVPVAIEAFCKVFMTLPALVKVDFSDNAFGPVGAKAVFEYISNAASLQELRLNNNGLGPEGGKLIGEALSNCQSANKTASRSSALRKVSIGRNRLENASSESLGKAFEAHGLIEEISLYQNGIRPEGIATLASAFDKCTSLTYLDLQDNTFTLSGSKAMAAAIVNCTKLRHINFGDCLLGAEGGKLVIEALCSGEQPIASNLTYLSLQYNEINASGAALFAKNLASFKELKHLFLNGNDFKSKGPEAKQILSGLQDMNKSDIVDEWDDMEADMESEEDEDEEESESEQEEADQEKADQEEELTKGIEKLEL